MVSDARTPYQLFAQALRNKNVKEAHAAVNMLGFDGREITVRDLKDVIELGSEVVFNRLLRKKADGEDEFPAAVEEMTAWSSVMFCKAAQSGHLSAVNFLLTKADGEYNFPKVVAGIAINENLPLRLAAQRGHLSVVNRLLAKADGEYEFPAVVEAMAAAGDNQSLVLAAHGGHLSVVNRLLAKKPDGEYEFSAVLEGMVSSGYRILRVILDGCHWAILNRMLQVIPFKDAVEALIETDSEQVKILLPDFYRGIKRRANMGVAESMLSDVMRPDVLDIVKAYLSDFDFRSARGEVVLPEEDMRAQSLTYLRHFTDKGACPEAMNAVLPEAFRLPAATPSSLLLSFSSLSISSSASCSGRREAGSAVDVASDSTHCSSSSKQPMTSQTHSRMRMEAETGDMPVSSLSYSRMSKALPREPNSSDSNKRHRKDGPR